MRFCFILLTDDTAGREETCDDVRSLINDGYEISDVIQIATEARKHYSGKFDNFWAATQEILDTERTVPHDRRHGTARYLAPVVLSIRDLMSQAEQKMNSMFPDDPKNKIPSAEYFRLQFLPHNSTTKTAKRYYGRFSVKSTVQKRTLHKHHVDHHYAAKQFKFMREMASKFNEISVCFFLDDKAAIPIGPIGTPVSTTRRQRPGFVDTRNECGLNAADHDIIPLHITPSVSIKLVPPSSNSGWYKGEPTVTLKCAVFEPSNGWRHMTELLQHYDASKDPPVIFIGTDGGPDHNMNNISVILSYVAFFIESDADFISIVRTPPYWSVINPAERFMATCNVALNGVSLAMDHPTNENLAKKIKNCLTKTQWREKQAKEPHLNLRKGTYECTKTARQILTDRISRLTYGDNSVKIGLVASDDEIDVLKTALWNVLPNFDRITEKLSKESVFSDPVFKDFMSNHLRLTNYSLTLKKCDTNDCHFHSHIRLDPTMFQKLKWLPTPIPDQLNSEKYIDFDNCYGKEPNDDYTPSKANKKTENTAKNAPFQLAHTRARMIIRCTDCKFPRLIYSQQKLKDNELLEIEKFLDDFDYVCGAEITKLQNVFINRKDVCYAPISKHYFDLGLKLPGYQMICYKCCYPNPTKMSKVKKLHVCDECNLKEISLKIK